jgi:hypothetical protein
MALMDRLRKSLGAMFNMKHEELNVLEALIEAAKPFTDGSIVDETCGTIPLMEALASAIEDAVAIVSRLKTYHKKDNKCH